MILKKMIFVFLMIFIGIFVFFRLVNAVPYGANYELKRSETGNASLATSINAISGNISEIFVSGDSITQSWQGYFGNVSGALQLADASGNIFYNWTSASAKGEVYASTNDSIVWTNIQCFNFTNSGGAGAMNLSELEESFNINSSDVDGVDETFNLNSHPTFYVANNAFSAGICNSTKIKDNDAVEDFNEVLLYDPDTDTVVFTSILNDNVDGFDNKKYDFEMLVLEDGHNSDTQTTTYYFYIELGS